MTDTAQPDRRPDYVVPETKWDKAPMELRPVLPTDEDGNPITPKPAAKAGKKE